ncbi:MAG: site-2 protease family protein [Candidatus Gribaldobacteria bacterium]|nr:site-2 protease family protein [Candidatus Gribaldobacteria bacterium]
MLINALFTDPISYLMMAVSLLFALTVHEYAHAQAADWQGDHTARAMGRLTLNPLAHLDAVGALFIFTMGFGWGKPVPFNLYALRNKKWGPSLVAIAGPLSNFLMAVVVGMILRFGHLGGERLLAFFAMFVWLNVLLGVFNLIPVPPLDGSHLALALWPWKWEKHRVLFMQGGFMAIFVAIIFMMYIGGPYIAQPLFSLITGLPMGF